MNNKNEVREEFSKLESKDSLIALLNKIYNHYAKISDPDLRGRKYFTKAQINFFLYNLTLEIEDTEQTLYKTFEISKKSGGKRIINAPKFGDFKDLLYCIDYLIRSIYDPHSNAFGFIEERSIVENAKRHLHRNYVYNIDLKDFFHSFDINRVKLSFFNKPFNLKGELEPLAYILASLVTCNIDGKRVLPQGSPVSPALTNHICWRLDHRLTGLAKRFGVNYSRYADDITFSSDHNVYSGDFLAELNRIIKLENLEINSSKTRLQKRGERQVVTGITVNEGLNVSKKYIKQLRMYLYYCEQYGIEKASEIYLIDYKSIRQDGELFISPGKLENILRGKLNYLSMVKGKDDPVHKKLSNRFNILFEGSASLIDKIILHWLTYGIDSARQMFYENRHKESSNKSELLYDDFEPFPTPHVAENEFHSLSDEKLFVLDRNASDYSFMLEYFDVLYGFQFQDKNQYEKELDSLAEKMIKRSIKGNVFVKEFFSSIDDNDFDLAIIFLKNKLKKNPIEFWRKSVFSTKESLEVYRGEFVVFKNDSVND